MLAKVLSSTLLGVDAWIIEVEVDLANGLPTFTTVGLPDASIRESRDRVKAAMVNSGFPFPLYSDEEGIFARDYRIKIYPTVVGTYPDGAVAFLGKAVTPEFTPKKAAALLSEAIAARKQREGGG